MLDRYHDFRGKAFRETGFLCKTLTSYKASEAHTCMILE